MGNPALEEFFGRPETIERLSETLQQASTGVNGLKGALDAEVSGLVPSSWEGQAASGFAQHWHQQSAMTAQLSQQFSQMSMVMRVLAAELRAALTEFQSAEMAAEVNRCYITPAYIVLPDSPLDLAADAAVPVIEGIVVASMAMAEAARLQAAVAVAAIRAEGAALTFLRDLTSFVETAAEHLTLVGALQGLKQVNTYGVKPLVRWMSHAKLGRFAPRNELGRFVSPKDLSWWETWLKSTDKKNWIALRGQSASRGAWGTAGKWAGRAGVGLSFSLGAIKQWMKDRPNPNLSTSARVARAATRGVAVGAGTWAGGLVGAKIGLGIGTAICPGVGSAVGTIAGGILGGMAGSGLGNWLANHTVDFAGKVADTATKAGSELLHGLESWNPSGSQSVTFPPRPERAAAATLSGGRPF